MIFILPPSCCVVPFAFWWRVATKDHTEWPDLAALVRRYGEVQAAVHARRAAGLQPPPEWLAELTQELLPKE